MFFVYCNKSLIEELKLCITTKLFGDVGGGAKK